MTLYLFCSSHIEPLFQKDQKVLELACGTGQFTIFLAEKSKQWIATDFSKKMIQETRKRINKRNVFFDVQDATKLSYENDSFDVVLIANGLHIMPHPEEALQEIKRILKPDGILIAPTFVYEEGINKFRLKVMEKIGFKTFHQWAAKEYVDFITSQGYTIVSNELINAKPLPECILICKNAGS